MNLRLLPLILLMPITAISQDLKLPSIFSSNMVLQQKANASFWGKTQPNTEIELTGSWGKTTKSNSDNNGSWKLTIPTPKAGGPYVVTVKSGKEVVEFKNVLIGEVWICSGQSNMEMTLAGWPPKDTIRNSANEIRMAQNTNLHYITIERNFSLSPESDIKGEWNECLPANAANISATAYFFGQKLQNKLKVPVGLIITSWGGTPVESWIAPSTLSSDSDFSETFEKYKTVSKSIEIYDRWLQGHKSIRISDKVSENQRWKNLDFQDAFCSLPETNDTDWLNIQLPQNFEKVTGDFDGAVWFRKKLNLPADIIGSKAEVSLAMIDDMDRVYINGKLIGATEIPGEWQSRRIYNIPAVILKEGENTIAVRVIDNTGGGGIWGTSDLMYLKTGDKTLNISGKWKFLPTAEFVKNTFYIFDAQSMEFVSKPKLEMRIGPNSPGVLYNGMIAPLTQYTIKGAIWYQGESNVGRAEQYSRIFPQMINSWRTSWGLGNFPFYFVQIAPYLYSGENNNESAYLRDAQRRSLSTPNTGMAVTLDIGSVETIHPCNKVDVGERLAGMALANDYKHKISKSGPTLKSITFKNGKAEVSFNYSDGLYIKENASNEFEIAGEDGIFIPAQAKVDNNKIVVSSDKIPQPAYVRYAFRNGSHASLFNKEGLPAPSFTSEKNLK